MVTYYQGSARKNRTSFQNAKVDILCSGICLNVPEFSGLAYRNLDYTENIVLYSRAWLLDGCNDSNGRILIL